jgi:TetR/AcrR family transcriptional regulator
MQKKTKSTKRAREPRSKEELPQTDSRETLLLAAIRLFAEQGFDGTTTRDIVQATGLNISLISYYFGGKEGLMGACLEYIQERIRDGASPSLTPAVSAQDYVSRIRGFVGAFLRSHVENPYMHRVVQREYERDSAVFRHMVHTRYVLWYKELTEFIAHAQKNLWIRSTIDPMTLAIGLYGAMVQQVRLDRFRGEIQGRSLKDPEHFAKVVDDLGTVFGDGLAMVRPSPASRG